MKKYKPGQMTAALIGVILLVFILSGYLMNRTPFDGKPGFSAWVSVEGKLRIRYYNNTAKSVLLNTYTPGYTISDKDKNLLDMDKARLPSALDWVRIPAHGAYDFYRGASYHEPLNPHEAYGIEVYTPTDSPPKSMIVEPSTTLYPSERITTNEK